MTNIEIKPFWYDRAVCEIEKSNKPIQRFILPRGSGYTSFMVNYAISYAAQHDNSHILILCNTRRTQQICYEKMKNCILNFDCTYKLINNDYNTMCFINGNSTIEILFNIDIIRGNRFNLTLVDSLIFNDEDIGLLLPCSLNISGGGKIVTNVHIADDEHVVDLGQDINEQLYNNCLKMYCDNGEYLGYINETYGLWGWDSHFRALNQIDRLI